MKYFKPTQEEKTIILILLSISFGLVVGVLSMREAVKEAEHERNLMMYHAKEMTEMNEILMLDMMKKQDTISDDE